MLDNVLGSGCLSGGSRCAGEWSVRAEQSRRAQSWTKRRIMDNKGGRLAYSFHSSDYQTVCKCIIPGGATSLMS